MADSMRWMTRWGKIPVGHVWEVVKVQAMREERIEWRNSEISPIRFLEENNRDKKEIS